jgi:hypothetical protein
MHTQVSQDLELCDAQIHALKSNVKVHEELKESIMKLRFQGLLGPRKDESQIELLAKKFIDCGTLIMSEPNKLSGAQFDRTLKFKNEQWDAKRF